MIKTIPVVEQKTVVTKNEVSNIDPLPNNKIEATSPIIVKLENSIVKEPTLIISEVKESTAIVPKIEVSAPIAAKVQESTSLISKVELTSNINVKAEEQIPIISNAENSNPIIAKIKEFITGFDKAKETTPAIINDEISVIKTIPVIEQKPVVTKNEVSNIDPLPNNKIEVSSPIIAKIENPILKESTLIISEVKESTAIVPIIEDPISAIIYNEHAIAASQSNNAIEQKPVVKNDEISVIKTIPVIEQKPVVTKNEDSNIDPLPNNKIEATSPIIVKLENSIVKEPTLIISEVKESTAIVPKIEKTIPKVINNEHAIAASQSNNDIEQKPVITNNEISVIKTIPVIEQKPVVTKNEVSNIDPLPNNNIEISNSIIAKIENPAVKEPTLIISEVKESTAIVPKIEKTIPKVINNEHAIAASQSNNAIEQKPDVTNDEISVINPLPVIEQKPVVTKNEDSNIEPLPNNKIEVSSPIIAKIENPAVKEPTLIISEVKESTAIVPKIKAPIPTIINNEHKITASQSNNVIEQKPDVTNDEISVIKTIPVIEQKPVATKNEDSNIEPLPNNKIEVSSPIIAKIENPMIEVSSPIMTHIREEIEADTEVDQAEDIFKTESIIKEEIIREEVTEEVIVKNHIIPLEKPRVILVSSENILDSRETENYADLNNEILINTIDKNLIIEKEIDTDNLKIISSIAESNKQIKEEENISNKWKIHTYNKYNIDPNFNIKLENSEEIDLLGKYTYFVTKKDSILQFCTYDSSDNERPAVIYYAKLSLEEEFFPSIQFFNQNEINLIEYDDSNAFSLRRFENEVSYNWYGSQINISEAKILEEKCSFSPPEFVNSLPEAPQTHAIETEKIKSEDIWQITTFKKIETENSEEKEANFLGENSIFITLKNSKIQYCMFEKSNFDKPKYIGYADLLFKDSKPNQIKHYDSTSANNIEIETGDNFLLKEFTDNSRTIWEGIRLTKEKYEEIKKICAELEPQSQVTVLPPTENIEEIHGIENEFLGDIKNTVVDSIIETIADTVVNSVVDSLVETTTNIFNKFLNEKESETDINSDEKNKQNELVQTDTLIQNTDIQTLIANSSNTIKSEDNQKLTDVQTIEEKVVEIQKIDNKKSITESDSEEDEDKNQENSKVSDFDITEDFFMSYSFFEIFDYLSFKIAYLIKHEDGKIGAYSAEDYSGAANYGGVTGHNLADFRIPIYTDATSLVLPDFTVKNRHSKIKYCNDFSFKVSQKIATTFIHIENISESKYKNMKEAQSCVYDVYDKNKKLSTFQVLFNKTFIDWCPSGEEDILKSVQESANNIFNNCKAYKKLSSEEFDKLPIKNMSDLSRHTHYLTNLSPLSGFINLSNLDLRGSKIKKIPRGIFSNMKNLKKLDLSENQILKLSPKSFYGLNNLEELYLGNNKITEISADTFDMLPKLKKVSLLSNTKIEFPNEAFDKLTELEETSLNEIDFMKSLRVCNNMQTCQNNDSKNNYKIVSNSNQPLKNHEYNNIDFSNLFLQNTWKIRSKSRSALLNHGETHELTEDTSENTEEYISIRRNIYYTCIIKENSEAETFKTYIQHLDKENQHIILTPKNYNENVVYQYVNTGNNYSFKYQKFEDIMINNRKEIKPVETIEIGQALNLTEFLNIKDKCKIPFEVENIFD
ncbi:hypothetical protein GCL57_04210 [Fluviispira multicolorata]|uniref:Uncharacterized protein n=1 Tax=Fluviispira multicolorata TaxID=2654512 RepID=A0A833N5Y3_9BACT|nr:hypothetical protein GCL57_04210 [Fluviispira multicolorata]